MHIALTVGHFNKLGGIERVTVQLALGYRQLGHEVTIFVANYFARQGLSTILSAITVIFKNFATEYTINFV